MSDYGTPPPPPGTPPPPGYQPGPGPMGPRDHPQGTVILILGILSLVCVQLLGPVAWIMGNKALREIDANPGAYTNRGTVNAGRICGIIGTVLLILAVIAAILLVSTGMMAATNGSY